MLAFTLSLFTCICAKAQTASLPGKWTGTVEVNETKATLIYTFALDSGKLTGDLQGPQGTVPLQNGTFKDSVLSFDIMARSILHQSGRFYGDSVTIDVKVRAEIYHIVLTKNK